MVNESRRNVHTRFEGKTQIIVFRGRVTYDYIEELRKEVKDMIEEAEGYIIDLRNAEQIDSTGLGLLINLAKYFIYNKNKMVILNNNQLFDELFKVSKLNYVFNICETKEEAFLKLAEEDEDYWNKLEAY